MIALLDVSTLVPALKPNVAVPRFSPVLLLSFMPTMVMAPDLAKMLAVPMVMPASTEAVPAAPMSEIPPVPVDSMVPLKLMPKLDPPAAALASPISEMACALLLEDRKVKPLP